MTFAYLSVTCCMSSNLGTMPSKLLPIPTEHGEKGIQVIGQHKNAVLCIICVIFMEAKRKRK